MVGHVARTHYRWLAAVLASVLCAPSLSAQALERPLPEARLDVITADATAIQAGIGLGFPVGVYLRPALIVAAGPATNAGMWRASVRVDALARFLLDPFRESRFGLYGAGGVSVLHDPWDRWRGVITVTLGVELPARASGVWAVEAGFGGGIRLGVALRRANRGRR